MIRAACRYATLGWPVFPLAPRSKVPLISREEGGHGACDATTDERILHRWWDRCPDANIAVTVPKLLVVDIDQRAFGHEVWAEIVAPHGWPRTLEARTGSDGGHLVFEAPDFEPRCKPWQGVDIVTGRHRYIVAAPSIHPCGGRYRWIERIPPQPLPDWLANLLRRPSTTFLQSTHDERRGQSAAFERAARYLANCPIAISGQGGHQTTFTIALKIASNFPELNQAELWLLLLSWNQRNQPPWSKQELLHKLNDALQSARRGAGRCCR